jgi:hypothetical protein
LTLQTGFGFSATRFPLSRSFNTKENALFNLLNILLTIGALVLISAVGTFVRAYRKNRREEAAPFLHYFEPDYDRNLFPLDSWSDDNVYRLQTRMIEQDIRDSRAAERYSKGNDTTRRD